MPEFPKSPYVVECEAGKKWYCTCGHSATQPFCDGAHKGAGTGQRPILVELEAAKKVAFCGCRQTKTPPYCDGSHKDC
ncbi:MAG: CDGSH iron-sulfur domain-containing protein [Candidatus Sumerlaeia bacterium]|nr:CDGSH iron-sulfur domain-containing protein [Candidatus Sumerlaeia bacterium]